MAHRRTWKAGAAGTQVERLAAAHFSLLVHRPFASAVPSCVPDSLDDGDDTHRHILSLTMFLMNYVFKPLAYVSLPVLVLKQLMEVSPPLVRYYIRLGLYISTLSVCSLWGAICSVGMPFVGPLLGLKFNANYVTARTFHEMAKRVVDVKFEVEGAEIMETATPAVLVCNHQSMLDVEMLGAYVSPVVQAYHCVSDRLPMIVVSSPSELLSWSRRNFNGFRSSANSSHFPVLSSSTAVTMPKPYAPSPQQARQ